MQILLTLLAILVYPGLLLAVGLGAFYAALTGTQSANDNLKSFRKAFVPASWQSTESFVNSLSIVLSGCGLVLLPWPWHPAPNLVLWLWAWGALEAAFLLPLFPALLTGTPPVVRAAMRTLQIGTTGRALLWVALGVGLLLHASWFPIDANGRSPLLAHGVTLLLALLTFPAAISWGPFAPEVSITPGGTNYGLKPTIVSFVEAAESVRIAALLATTLVALSPISTLAAPLGLFLILAMFGAVGLLLRRLTGRFIRLTLPAAIQLCLWRGVPLGVAAVIALALVSS